jgi:hypothetical protein
VVAGAEGGSVPALSPPLPPKADNAKATISTAAIPITAIVARRARVGGPEEGLGLGAAAACRGSSAIAFSDVGPGSGTVAGSGSPSAPRSTIAAVPFSWPHSGQVQAVVPGRMWNRTPQFPQVANTQAVPQDTQVYPAASPVAWRV